MAMSRRRHEGYLMIDHRPGMGLGAPGETPLAHGRIFEAPTYTCSHCQRIVVINPLRTRERGYCPKCDHHVCDECELVRVEAGGACRSFEQLADQVLEAVVAQEQRSRAAVLIPPAGVILTLSKE